MTVQNFVKDIRAKCFPLKNEEAKAIGMPGPEHKNTIFSCKDIHI